VRKCSPCSACCVVLGVNAIKKPAWERCKDQSELGCGIYSSRPKPCGDYQCKWLAGELEENERPDLVRLIVDSGTTKLFSHTWGDDALVVRETSPKSSETLKAKRLIHKLLGQDRVVFVKHYGGGSEFLSHSQKQKDKFSQLSEIFQV